MGKIREFVAHQSPQTRELIGFIAALLPIGFRYGQDFSRTSGLIDRARKDVQWGRAERERLLRRTLELSTRAEFYASRTAYDNLKSINDPFGCLYSLPVLDRESLSKEPELFLVTDRNKVDLVSTSGSSGKPALFYLDKQRGASEWSYVCDSWRSSGYKLGDWRAVLRGVDIGQSRGLVSLKSRSTNEMLYSAFNLSEAVTSDFWTDIDKRKIQYVHGYPSALAQIAQAALTSGSRHRFSVSGIFPVSESVLPAQMELFERAFPNAKVLPFYGLSERVAFAEFDEHIDGYRFYPFYGLVEILDDNGQPVSPGERGRIVATSLKMVGAPLLRYDTGDRATFVENDEYGNPIIANLRGKRAQEHLVSRDGALISTSALNLHSKSYEGVFAYRFVQSTRGQVELLVVLEKSSSSSVAKRLAEEFQSKCGEGIDFTPLVVDSLPPTVNGKIRLIDQKIPGVPKE